MIRLYLMLFPTYMPNGLGFPLSWWYIWAAVRSGLSRTQDMDKQGMGRMRIVPTSLIPI